jgi:hypothetical protein
MKKAIIALLASSAAALALTATTKAEAAQYVVYVHGRSQTYWTGNTYTYGTGYTTAMCDYNATSATLAQASSSATATGISWNGKAWQTDFSGAGLQNCLAKYCSGSNSCIAIGYSNGVHQLNYTLANYPSKVANLSYVFAGSGASGGTDLLDNWGWAESALIDACEVVMEPLCGFGLWCSPGGICGGLPFYPSGVDADLFTSTARNDYNHNATNGRTFYQISGQMNGTVLSTNLMNWSATLINGSSDGVVPFSSTYGCVNSGSQPWNCAQWSGHISYGYAHNGGSMDCDATTGTCEGVSHIGGIDSRAAYWW